MPAGGLPPELFEQIPWADWLDHYWIPTISRYAPRLFVKACPHQHEGHDHIDDDAGNADLRTEYFEGADGFTYERRRAPQSGNEQIIAVYKTKKDL